MTIKLHYYLAEAVDWAGSAGLELRKFRTSFETQGGNHAVDNAYL